jgi:hypothetical protein
MGWLAASCLAALYDKNATYSHTRLISAFLAGSVAYEQSMLYSMWPIPWRRHVYTIILIAKRGLTMSVIGIFVIFLLECMRAL